MPGTCTRLSLPHRSAQSREPPATRVTPVEAGGVRGEWVVADHAAPDRRSLYLHGGGYVICSPATHRALAGRLSQAAQVSVLVLDYRLAPEHPYPAAVDDALAALRWLGAHGYTGPAAPGAGDQGWGRPGRLGTCISPLLAGLAKRFVDESGKGFGFCGAFASALGGCKRRLRHGERLVGQPHMDEQADQHESDQQELIKQ